MAIIKVQIVFDIVCAWCYIAKRNLDRGISLYQKTYPGGKSDTFDLTWTPYYLDYNPHPHSVDKLHLADIRLQDMTPAQRAALSRRMEKAGQAAGIPFKWGGMIGPSTRDAHRLVYLSRGAGPQVLDALVEGLFDAYHCREEDVSRRDVLSRVAVEAGLGGAEVDGWLDSGEAAEAVDEMARVSKEMESAGVPIFVVQEGVYRLAGSSDPMELLEIL